MEINRKIESGDVLVEMEGARGVVKKVLVGPEEGSDDIVMRYFKVLPGGYTVRHKHQYEHLVQVEKGRGVAIDEKGQEHPLSAGHSIFVARNEVHQFTNPYSEPFEFICVIPNYAK
ncbi:MAG: cupin domain-containing protein [Deltaproteobacteria bacterium]|nr:cupin domain-containing protein [Deltaproteobacteria bacterium]MBW2122007.1 cupin domain-containing protein [Deltaproteobacteria bacterium]